MSRTAPITTSTKFVLRTNIKEAGMKLLEIAQNELEAAVDLSNWLFQMIFRGALRVNALRV